MPAADDAEEEDDAPLSEEAEAEAAAGRRIRGPAPETEGADAPALAVSLAFMVGFDTLGVVIESNKRWKDLAREGQGFVG